MGEKLLIYNQFDGAEMNATTYYRILQPIQAMVKYGIDPPSPMLDNGSIYISNEDRALGLQYTQLQLHYHQCNPSALASMQQLQGYRPRPGNPIKAEGIAPIWYPPCIIADTDDDLMRVMPLNTAFSKLGTHAPDGQGGSIELGRGAKVEIVLPEWLTEAEDKEKDYFNESLGRWVRVLWEDGKQDFDVFQNQVRIESWRRFLKFAKLVTCSTPRSEAYVKRECPSANTFIAPNIIDIAHYPQGIELSEHPNEVRILWQGSITHHECLWPLVPSFVKVAKKYPHAKFVFFGGAYKWLYNKLGEQAQHIPFVPYPEYKGRLSVINHDINLCPLGKNLFNDSRSAIKWAESSIISKPAATLAQRWGAYQDEIQHGETGMLFDGPEDFEEHLCTLIESATLRKTLAENAKQWQIENRSPQVLGPRLWEKYKETLANHRESCGPPMELEDVPVSAEHHDTIAS